MKHLELVHIILLLGMGGLLSGTAGGELTAYQNLISSAEVGQMVTVTVSLTYNGFNSTQVVVTPSLPSGVVANGGGQSIELYPGVTQEISYPLTAQQSGSYWIVSDISYAEGGAWRSLRLEAPFTATVSSASQPEQQQQPYPVGESPSGGPVVYPWQSGSTYPTDPLGVPSENVPEGALPTKPGGYNTTPEGTGPTEGMPQEGMGPATGAAEGSHMGQ
ncbi:MAG: hypothetical protein LUQ59_05515 [Methanothrix sp.]|nr:hypothetical protein [Methanothrix sp.]